MPIYAFHCEACGRDVEIFRRVDLDEALRCPDCASRQLRRVFSQVAIVKGGSAPGRDVRWIDQSIRARLAKGQR
jgi:putative FmdB family regulatory protein